MYPNLYYFFQDVFGIEIPFFRAVNSFGFFVALAFLTGIWVLSHELKRKESEGELIPVKKKKMVGLPPSFTGIASNFIIGFILGYKLIYAFFNSAVFSAFPDFLFSGEGSVVGGVIGAAGLGFWKYYEEKKQQKKVPEEVIYDFHHWDHVGPLLILAVVWGFIGAKLFAWFESGESFSDFISGDPFRGLTVYGGLICATIAMTVYMYRHKLPILKYYDAAAPGFLLAYGVGRIGCHVAGDGDWGIVNNKPNPGWLPDWLWAYRYPHNVNRDGIPIENCTWDDYCMQLAEPVYPTPLYEFLMCLLGFGILWMLRKRINIAGVIFMLFLVFNGVERFLIEKIRVNETIGSSDLTQAELISILLVIAGMIGIVVLYLKRKKPAL